MGNYFDIQDNPNDPPLSHYLLYAGIGAVINPASSLVGFVFLGLLDLLLTAIGIAPKTTFFSFILGYVWLLPVCIIPQSLFGALASVVIGLIYGRQKANNLKTPKQKLYFNIIAASLIGITGPVVSYAFFFIIGKTANLIDLFAK